MNANLIAGIEDCFSDIHDLRVQGWRACPYTWPKPFTSDMVGIEIRRCWVADDPVAFEHIRHDDRWTDLRTIIRVERERHLSGKVERETAYYVSSLAPDARQLPDITCQHRGIANSLHWVLDVTFGAIDRGFVILVGVGHGDGDAQAQWLARKIAGRLRRAHAGRDSQRRPGDDLAGH